MIFVTGDTYGQWYRRFKKKVFPQQKGLTKADYVIILGNFGIFNHGDEWMQHVHFIAHATLIGGKESFVSF